MENTRQHNQRILYLDLTKAFAIFCVILGHVIQLTSVEDPYHDSLLFQFIYAYHMPLFMMVSGFFLGKSLQQPFGQFFHKRFIQLIVPILTFGSLFFLFRNTLYCYVTDARPVSLMSVFTGNDMWFLRYLFGLLMIAYISKRIFKNTLVTALLPMVLLFSLTRSGIFRLYPYLWAGYCFAAYNESLMLKGKRNMLISMAVFVVSLCFWKGDYDASFRFVYFSPTLRFDMEHTFYVFVRLMVGLSGSLTFLFLFRYLSVAMPLNKFTAYASEVGRHTLGIYCVQVYLLEFGLGHLKPQFEQVDNVVFHVLFAVILLVVFNFIVACLERNRWTALLFLGREKAFAKV